jgi:hypothetical protein
LQQKALNFIKTRKQENLEVFYGIVSWIFDFLTFDFMSLTIVPSIFDSFNASFCRWLRKRNGYSQDFKTSPVTVATLASDKGTLINPLHFDSVPFNVFRRKRNVWEYVKSSFWNVDFTPGISLIIN